MYGGVTFSAMLHGAALALLIFGLPDLFEPLPTDAPIPVELLILDSEKEPTPEPEPEPEEEPKAEEKDPLPDPPSKPDRTASFSPPKPQDKPLPKIADPNRPEPQPVQQAAVEPPAKPVPPPPEPEPKPEPEPEPEPEEQTRPPAPLPQRKPAVQVAAKPEPEPEEQEDRLQSILKNVLRDKEEPQPKGETQEARAPEAGETRVASVFEQREIVALLQNQMKRCWRLDAGAREAADLVVEINVLLNPDGSVLRAEIVDVARTMTDAFYRSAAENARRSVLKCSPFEGLPTAKYKSWREVTLRFNPSEMF